MWGYNRPRSSEELYHFGILGMKWGVRRSEAQLGRNGAAGGAVPKYSDSQSKKIVDDLQEYYDKNKGFNEAGGRDFVVGKNPDIKSASRLMDKLVSDDERAYDEVRRVVEQVLAEEKGELISRKGIAKIKAAESKSDDAHKKLNKELARLADGFIGKYKDTIVNTKFEDDLNNEDFALGRAKDFVTAALYAASFRRVTNHPDAED